MAEERAEIKINKKSLKRQLIGAFVLIAAIVVLFPVLFDGSGRIPVKKVTDIPPVIKNKPFELAKVETPDFTWAENELVVDVDINAFDENDDPIFTEAANENQKGALPQNNKTAQNTTSNHSDREAVVSDVELKTGWSIQLGSFKNEKNAQKLLSDLKASGFSAWIRHRAASDNSSLSQVFAGPWVHEAQARAINKELSDKFKVTGMVLRPR